MQTPKIKLQIVIFLGFWAIFTVSSFVGYHVYISRDGNSPPHIIFLMADDLGWNHVSWHNPDIYTPRMEVYSIVNLYFKN